MDAAESKKFFLWAGAAFAVFYVLMVGLTFVVDPYLISNFPAFSGITDKKNGLNNRGQVHKRFSYWLDPKAVVVFGNSRVERGIRPSSAAFRTEHGSVYNFATGGQRLPEALEHFEEVAALRVVKTAVFSLDPFYYPWDHLPSEGKAASQTGLIPGSFPVSLRYAVDYLLLLASPQATLASLQTLIYSRRHPGPPDLKYMPDGWFNGEALNPGFTVDNLYPGFLSHGVKVQAEHSFSEMKRWIEPLLRLGKISDHAILRRILRVAHENDIRLIFFVSPEHAYDIEAVAAMGGDALVRQWKSEILCALAAEAKTAGRAAPFPLWDFFYFNEVTTQSITGEVPAFWFHDPVHYFHPTGNAILSRLFDLDDPRYKDLNDFGFLLTPANFDETMEKEAAMRRDFLKHRADFEDVLHKTVPIADFKAKLPREISDIHVKRFHEACRQ